MKNSLIYSLLFIAFLFSGCNEDKSETQKEVSVKSEKVESEIVKKEPEEKFIDQVKHSTSNIANKIVEESKKVVEVAPEAIKSVSEKVSVKTQEIAKDVMVVANETKEKIEKEISSTIDSVKESIDDKSDLISKGKSLYAKCASCHGTNAQNPALGKSQIIKGWEIEKTINALNGYKNGTYGSNMKAIMKGQVATLGDEDIKALATYINSL